MRSILAVNKESFQRHVDMAVQRMRRNDLAGLDSYVRRQNGHEFERIGNVALIHVTGVTTYSADLFSYFFGGTSYQGIISKMEAAGSSSDISEIVINFDTPGGEVTGCPEAAQVIYNTRQKKKVTAIINPEAASAGYWLASQASTIVGIPTSEVGSLGVMSVYTSISEALEKEGVDTELVRASISPNKNLGAPFEEKTDEARQERQRRVDKQGNKFVSDVARGRGVTDKVVSERFGKGSMLFFDDALKVGMVDSLSSFEQAMSKCGAEPEEKARSKKKRRYHSQLAARRAASI